MSTPERQITVAIDDDLARKYAAEAQARDVTEDMVFRERAWNALHMLELLVSARQRLSEVQHLLSQLIDRALREPRGHPPGDIDHTDRDP